MAPDEVRAYDAELVTRLATVLGDDLLAVYATGSTALGDYVPGQSDLDRLAVVARPLARPVKEAIVARVRDEALPCPARGLELVVSTRAAVGRPVTGGEPDLFELNLNTGPRMPFHVAYDPAEEPSHWFVLDRAIVRERGSALLGPPPANVVAPLPRETVLDALAASLRWHREKVEVAGANLVLNALRAWRFLETGAWASKGEAAAWARERGADGELVDAALAARTQGGGGPEPEAAARLAADVLARIDAGRAGAA